MSSLIALAAGVAVGTVVHRRAGRCACKVGLQFASVGALTAAAAGWLADGIPDPVLAVAFAVMLVGVAAWFVLRAPRQHPCRGGAGTPP